MKLIKDCFKKYERVLRYLIVGGLTFLLNLAVFVLCYNSLKMGLAISNVISWIVAVLFAFFTNKYFVFRTISPSRREFIKEMFLFFGARVLSLIIELILMWLMVDVFVINSSVSKIICQVVVIVLNYIFSKLFVFKEKVS